MIIRPFLHTFFRLLYNELAWTYDLVAWLVSFGQWTAWGRVAIPRLHGPRVLELAHGPGHLLVAMTRAGLEPVGLDLSPQMGRMARRRLQAGWTGMRMPGLPNNRGDGTLRAMPPLVRARAQAMPFRAGSFDSIVSAFPAEFIFDPDTLHEITRVMEPAGQAVVVMGVMFKQGWPARFLRWLYRVTYQDAPAPPGLADAIAEAGLEVEQTREPMSMVDVLMIIARKR